MLSSLNNSRNQRKRKLSVVSETPLQFILNEVENASESESYGRPRQETPWDAIELQDDSSIENVKKKRQRIADARILDKKKIRPVSHKQKTVADASNFVPPGQIGSLKVDKKKCTVVKYGQPVVEIEDADSLFAAEDADGLWARYQKQGYLFLRGVIDRAAVLKAQEHVAAGLRDMDLSGVDGRATSVGGWTVDCTQGERIASADAFACDGLNSPAAKQRWLALCSDPRVSELPHSEAVRRALQLLAAGKANAERAAVQAYSFHPNFSWMRVKAPGESTDLHADVFYMRRDEKMFGQCKVAGGSCLVKTGLRDCAVCGGPPPVDGGMLRCDECFCMVHLSCLSAPDAAAPKELWYCAACQPRHTLGTCWIPLGDVGVRDGGLVLMPGSMDLPRFYKPSPGSQLPESFWANAKGRAWHAGAFAAGDVVLFDSHAVHCTARNEGAAFRLSLDFRWNLVPLRPNTWDTALGRYARDHGHPV